MRKEYIYPIYHDEDEYDPNCMSYSGSKFKCNGHSSCYNDLIMDNLITLVIVGHNYGDINYGNKYWHWFIVLFIGFLCIDLKYSQTLTSASYMVYNVYIELNVYLLVILCVVCFCIFVWIV